MCHVVSCRMLRYMSYNYKKKVIFTYYATNPISKRFPEKTCPLVGRLAILRTVPSALKSEVDDVKA